MGLKDELDHYAKLVIWKLSALEVNRGYVWALCAHLQSACTKYKYSFLKIKCFTPFYHSSHTISQ